MVADLFVQSIGMELEAHGSEFLSKLLNLSKLPLSVLSLHSYTLEISNILNLKVLNMTIKPI